MSEKSYPRGHRDGIKWAITWLHKRAVEMNDHHAKAILNTAAFNMAKQEPFLFTSEGPASPLSPSDSAGDK